MSEGQEEYGNREGDITVPELKRLMSDIYEICENNINSREFYDNLLRNLKNNKYWGVKIVRTHGGALRDLVAAVRDYNSGDFRNVNVRDITFASSLLLYYTEPTHLLPTVSRAMDEDTELWVTELLLPQCAGMLDKHRQYQIESNRLLHDILGEIIPPTITKQEPRHESGKMWGEGFGMDEANNLKPIRSEEGRRGVVGRTRGRRGVEPQPANKFEVSGEKDWEGNLNVNQQRTELDEEVGQEEGNKGNHIGGHVYTLD